MKKMIIITAAAILSLTACKKERTCSCVEKNTILGSNGTAMQFKSDPIKTNYHGTKKECEDKSYMRDTIIYDQTTKQGIKYYYGQSCNVK